MRNVQYSTLNAQFLNKRKNRRFGFSSYRKQNQNPANPYNHSKSAVKKAGTGPASV